jgi:CRISPR/Cas system-associated exonuclease Cas4 (RecB family)
MENLLLEWHEASININDLVRRLKGYLADVPVPKSIRDGIASFDRSLESYDKATESDDVEKIAQAAKMVAVYGQSIGQAIPKFKSAEDKVKNLGVELLEFSNKFRSLVEDSPLEYKTIKETDDNKGSVELHNFQFVKKNLKLLVDEHERHDQRVKKFLTENEVRIESVSALSRSLEADVRNEIKKYLICIKALWLSLKAKKRKLMKY